MAIETTCGGCGKQLSVGDEHAGRRARCPACGQIYAIPLPNLAPPDLPTASQSAALQSPSSDSFAETTAGLGSGAPAGIPITAPTPAVNLEQFWMRSIEGAEYGPVDRATLNRWFNEGRVGPGYLIRQSETGMWQGAEFFKPGGRSAESPFNTSSANPYATTTSAGATYGQMYAKPDQSGLVLAFGILAWFFCPIFGFVAWIMGHNGLRDIRLGLVDPANKGLMQAGYYLGMVCALLWLFCGGGLFVVNALGILLSSMN